MRKIKTISFLLLCITVFVLFYLFGSTVTESIKHSLKMCYSSIIPSLFPYFIISQITISVLKSTKISPALYAFVCSLLSGYPNGTASVCTLYNEGIIKRKNAVALLFCTANASPAFIVSFVGICILKSKTAGTVIMISQLISALCCFFVFRTNTITLPRPSVFKFSEVLTNSISKSVEGTLQVCGSITFMGVIADLIIHFKIDLLILKILFFIPTKILRPILIGMIELTRGISLVDFTDKTAFITASVIVGFSGISIILQCAKHANCSKLPVYPIIINKLIYAITMPAITAIILNFNDITYITQKNNTKTVIFSIIIIFSILFLYLFFDKYIFKIYNKEKRQGDLN